MHPSAMSKEEQIAFTISHSHAGFWVKLLRATAQGQAGAMVHMSATEARAAIEADDARLT